MSRRNAVLSRAGSRLGLAALAVVVLIVLIRLLFPSAVLAASAPFLRLSASLTNDIGSFMNGFDDTAKLAAERDALESENATLNQENAVLTAKVGDLQGLLGTTPTQAEGIVAPVLARPPETSYDTLVVAAGSAAGVVVGDVAYAASNVPLGVVTAVSANAARITLLSASGEATPAWVGATRVPITLRGVGAGAFRAEAPRAASTTVGDMVYVAGPGSVPVGTVRAEGGEASAPSITLSISGIVNVFSITSVLIKHEGSATWPAGSPAATTTSAL